MTREFGLAGEEGRHGDVPVVPGNLSRDDRDDAGLVPKAAVVDPAFDWEGRWTARSRSPYFTTTAPVWACALMPEMCTV